MVAVEGRNEKKLESVSVSDVRLDSVLELELGLASEEEEASTDVCLDE